MQGRKPRNPMTVYKQRALLRPTAKPRGERDSIRGNCSRVPGSDRPLGRSPTPLAVEHRRVCRHVRELRKHPFFRAPAVVRVRSFLHQTSAPSGSSSGSHASPRSSGPTPLLIRYRRAQRAQDLAPTLAEIQGEGVTSLRQLAAGLNARGIPAPRRGEWSAVQVRRVLDRLNATA